MQLHNDSQRSSCTYYANHRNPITCSIYIPVTMAVEYAIQWQFPPQSTPII